MAGMRHIMIWRKIIHYQLENSEQQLKQSPDNNRVIIAPAGGSREPPRRRVVHSHVHKKFQGVW